MKWEVQLAGAKADLEELCAVFTDSSFRIAESGDMYILTSSQFDVLSNDQEVASAARELINVLAGASKLSLGSRTNLSVSCVACLREDGIRQIFMRVSETIHVSARADLEILRADGTVTHIFPAYRVPQWMELARMDVNIAKAFRLFGNGDETWVNLYRILEVIIDDVGSEKVLIEKKWATRAKIKSFMRCANSVAIAGDQARHGSEDTSPPNDPMDISTAKSLVSLILQSWLNEKASAGNQ